MIKRLEGEFLYLCSREDHSSTLGVYVRWRVHDRGHSQLT